MLDRGSKGKEFEQLIAGALDFANDLQYEGEEDLGVVLLNRARDQKEMIHIFLHDRFLTENWLL